MGSQVNPDNIEQSDTIRLEFDQHGLRWKVVRGIRAGKALGDARDTAQTLENGLGAPVAAATEANTLDRHAFQPLAGGSFWEHPVRSWKMASVATGKSLKVILMLWLGLPEITDRL